MLTTDFVPGTPNWIDLGASDTDAAAEFYTAVFGWTHQPAGPGSGGYGFFLRDGATVAALGPLTGEGANPAWTPYFHTRDAEATAGAVERAGGAVRVPPMDVFTAGRMAAFTDPQGAEFAVWQPGDRVGVDAVMEPAALCWTELRTTDAAAARDFYRAVLAWQYEDMDMGGTGPYTVVSAPGGGAGGDAGQGGIVELAALRGENLPDRPAAAWLPYFGAADCDATFAAATSHGATPVVVPTDIPGVGRTAVLEDPAGARFALITGDPTTP
ncbi:VOC family protein [Streptomyces sp. NPDC015131]|uniref:VOC family protein n=1 Tax=Streptomyces sp. NPDC015131 TaxID=3364941 RepID=UPI0036FBAAED